MNILQRFLVFYRQYTMRFWMYISLTLAFVIFFGVVLSNKNSRYNQRLEQSDTRISTRMQMMRENYLRQDSIFRVQDSIRKVEEAHSTH